MKKSLFYILAAGAVLSSCAKEFNTPDDITAGKEEVTIYASIEKTKSTVDGTGIYSWQASEKISVVEQDAVSGTDFTLTDAEAGAFSGTKSADKDLVFAVSPASALTDAIELGGDVEYTITLPDSYDNYVPGTTNAVMVGEPNGGSYKFTFSHVMPLLKFTYVNVPIGTKKFVYSNSNNFVTGYWENIDTISGLTLSEDDSNFNENGSDVTLTLSEAVYEANQTMEFYVPVPASTYKDFSIKLQDASSADIAGTAKSKAGLNIPLAAGDIFPTPTVNLAAASKGAEWTYTFTKSGELVTDGYTVNGLKITSSTGADNFDSTYERGAQFPQGATPTITIPYTGYVESVSAVLSTNGTATVGFKVDDKYIQVGGNDTQDIASGTENKNQTYTARVNTNHYRKGDIKIELTSNSGKRVYIKSITINGDARSEAGLSYAETAVAKATGAAKFTNALSNPNSLTGIAYSSSTPSVATVDAGTGEVTVVAAGETTISATFAGDEYYKAGNASYTLTVAAAYLTLPAATTPTKADCTDDSTVSFDVDSNIDWTAAKGTDSEGIIKSVSTVGNTVTVTFNANAGAEKTAEVTVTPVEVGYRATLTKNMTVTQKKYEKVDVLTQGLTELATSGDSGYTLWTGKSYAGSGHSDAVYAGKTNKGVAYIQMNGTAGNSIVSTTSGGSVTKVSVEWASAQATTTGRTITVYGRNTAYSGPSDTSTNPGTALGTIVKDTNDYIDVDGYYEYVALVANGALYLDVINIYWGDAKSENGLEWQKSGSLATTDTATMLTGDDTMPTATLYNPNSLSVTYSSSDPAVATINASTGAITLVGAGSTTITATFAGDATYKPGTPSYTLTVTDSRAVCATPTFSPVAGSVSANTVVTVSSATAGATIYYTTDGSTPTASSSHGTVGTPSVDVTIDVAKTVKAIAVKDDCVTSDVASATYTVAGVSSPLPDPSGVTITALTATTFTGTWTNDPNASDYEWTVSSSSTYAGIDGGNTVASGTTSHANCTLSAGTYTVSLTGLTLSGEYYLYVKAKGDGVTYTDSDNANSFGMGLIILTPDASTTGSSSKSYVTTETEATVNGVKFKLNNYNPDTNQLRGNQSSASSNFVLYNTTAISGKIRKIDISRTSGTGTLGNTKCYISFGASVISTNPATTGTASTAGASTSTVYWTNDGNNTFFYIGMAKGATSGNYYGSITIMYAK